jgi:hypothetical protein
MKNKIFIFISLFTLFSCGDQIQNNEAKIKIGTYYFGGWSGKCPYDDGTPENDWAKGMPTSFTKKLATEFSEIGRASCRERV